MRDPEPWSSALDRHVQGLCIVIGVAAGTFLPRPYAIGFGAGALAVSLWWFYRFWKTEA